MSASVKTWSRINCFEFKLYLQIAKYQGHYRPSGPPYRSLNGNVFENVVELLPSSVWNATVLGVIGFNAFDVPRARE